jgi:lysozyme
MKDKLTQQLRRDEGEVLHAYQDHLGYWTLGIGRLIDKRKGGGISEEEAAYLLSNDIDKYSTELTQKLPWVESLDEARKGVLFNMAFNLGVPGLLGFKQTLGAVQAGEYEKAAEMMLLSKWAGQVGDRAKRLAKQMKEGVWY